MNIDLTAIMEREGINHVRRYRALGQWAVVLEDGRCGTGKTVGEALEAAKQPDADNVLKVAA